MLVDYENRYKLGILVGAAPIGNIGGVLKSLLTENDRRYIYVVAADAGMRFFLEEGLQPDIWIGDMDSAGDRLVADVRKQFPELLVNTCSPIKDDTDTALGLRLLVEKGCKECMVFGGVGGKREDHTIANIQNLHYWAKRDVHVTMMSDMGNMMVLRNDAVRFEERDGGDISVISLTDVSKNVQIRGLFYEYSGDLTNDVALGVSNSFNGNAAEISVEDGSLLIIMASDVKLPVRIGDT